ncbi:MAG: DUF4249 domain-containing protein [Cyclobacteriaceae bacterium]|nr:DUF4249 domain-containing protein [Cyclobacteriaceae bacterium]
MKNTALVIVLFVIMSCSTVVEYDVPFEKPHIVVNSIIHPDTFFIASLTESHYILDYNYYYDSITDARVEVYEAGALLGELNMLLPAIYANADIRPMPGVDYQLKVIRPGFDEVSAETLIPVKSPGFELLNVQKKAGMYGENVYEFTIELEDIINEDNYYEFSIQAYTHEYDYSVDPPVVIDSFPLNIGLKTNDALFKEDTDETWGEIFTFDDNLFKNAKISLNFETTWIPFDHFKWSQNPSEPVMVDLLIVVGVLNKELYLYKMSVDRQRETVGNPLTEPAFVYNNINNGLGIFSGYNAKKIPYVLEYYP